MRNPLTPVARRLATHEWVMRMRPFITWLEQQVRKLTKGRMGVLDLAGLPSVQITVAGRKTGLPRTTSLLYVPEGDDYLLLGSNWGLPKHPVWSANLMAASTAIVRHLDDVFEVKVELVSDDERARVWDFAVDFWPGYAMEHRRSGGREFRILRLRRS